MKVCCQTGYRTQDLTYESGALPIALRGPAKSQKRFHFVKRAEKHGDVPIHLHLVQLKMLEVLDKQANMASGFNYPSWPDD